MNHNDIEQSPILISLIPNLMGGEGHIIPYHISVSKAAKILGWQHLVILPPDSKVSNLPTNWYACLSSENLEAKIHPFIRILKFIDILKLSLSIAKKLRQYVLINSRPSIIFLERFIHVQLLALLIAIYLVPTPTNNLSVWLLYRRDIHKDKTAWIYKNLNQAIKLKLKPGKFKILTDSDILANSISNYFQDSVSVMPIPHTEFIDIEDTRKQDDEIVCWWAGTPRLEKGWEIVKSLVNCTTDEANKICVVAAQSSQLISTTGSVRIRLVADNLSNLDYLTWLKKSDIILLPYDANAYKERTSGIFAECIMAGKIPVVTAGTWMAKELSKYNVQEVIIDDWSQTQIITQKIIKFANSLELKAKIKEIQKNYRKFHTVESYAVEIKKLFDTSDHAKKLSP
ncbi:hypothetical protein CLI64_01880 [Nostoc sp. CENA543]|uniref:hypothetical protein n=1 Tax=Nostoc sp. CENA543 TaxID=1869241 RepID=UPI000CA3288F|nr:hypothetical protein [Nostoc sp. CENA543]AUT04174.1 hypothetical protein CLI64_01880 [Nostoc sp. CENA543]